MITEDHVKILLYNQLCSLKFLHSANLVHRDIKPANLLLDDQCRVMVCDFGLARSLPEKDELDRNLRKVHQKAYEKIQKAPAENLDGSLLTNKFYPLQLTAVQIMVLMEFKLILHLVRKLRSTESVLIYSHSR